jgi:formylglycine-generating enzyme required for sulfatase activity
MASGSAFAISLTVVSLAAAQNGGKGVALPPEDPMRFLTEKKLALVIGINNYPEESGLSKLKWAVKDATDLAAELTRQGYTVDPLLDERVTKVAIRVHLTNMLKRLDPNSGTVVFAFSGHGGQVGRDQYLATYESSAEDLDKTGASVEDLRKLLEDSGAPRKMMFLDACRNVTTPGGKDSAAPIEPMVELSSSKGLRLLVSTGPRTRSYEYDSLQHGLFTYYMIEGLKGAAARADGLVTFGTLASYVTRTVKDYNPSQIPYTDGQSTGEFPLGGKYKPPAAPAAVTAGSYQPARLDAAAEAWVMIKDSKDAVDFDAFAHTFPSSDLAGAARLRADQLRRAGAVPAVNVPRGGQVKVNPMDGQKYTWIPPGTFAMGCSPADSECYDDEKPSHDVTITKGFWMGQTSVTVGAYKRYAQATGKPMPPEKLGSWTLNSGAGNDSMPVVGVTWDEAVGYCGWAGMRLPTEAEWELAARGGTTGARYGDLDKIAWYGDNSGRQPFDSTAILWSGDQKDWTQRSQNYVQRLYDNGNGPKLVGQKRPNAYGLFDMLGNLWQWAADWYGGNLGEKQDPSGPPTGTVRVRRGGAWSDIPRDVRVSRRSADVPDHRSESTGLRCVVE